MQWPVSSTVYPDSAFRADLQQTIIDVANLIAEFEPVTLLCDKNYHSTLSARLSADVELWDIPTEDLWCRDSGPIFVTDGKGRLAVIQIQFNGWGEKQINRNDSRVASRVAERLGLELIPTGLRGEGGGVEHDGHGLLIAHESSWVISNRNPGLSRNEIEARLLKAYGANRMIWSKGVKGQDITDYHIDSLVRFSGPDQLLMNLPDTPDMRNPFHVAALETYDNLLAAGLAVDVIPEPDLPTGMGTDFVSSYVNYYVCNGAVIAPEFGDRETDEIARAAFARWFPGREIVTLNVDPLGEIGGGIHCATQQMPAL
jgi:agmatine deiminase